MAQVTVRIPLNGQELTTTVNACSRCEHVWTGSAETPVRCAKCRNPNWNSDKPRRTRKPKPAEVSE